MATLYILFSEKLDMYYVGSCKDLTTRLREHLNKTYSNAFTSKADDWEVFFELNNLNYSGARAIESHIKRMKSRVYIENLKKYSEISEKLIEKYSAGSSR